MIARSNETSRYRNLIDKSLFHFAPSFLNEVSYDFSGFNRKGLTIYQVYQKIAARKKAELERARLITPPD